MTYDAFVSYSHTNDAVVAAAVQRAMQRLARPWYRARALRIFRDESALSANPHLWSSIQDALGGSEWLVLLGSPEAAASEWVDREVRHWLAAKSADRILVVVTDGTLEWDAAARRLRGSAVPPAVLDAFTDEPRHLDLRWARTETDLDVHNPRFRDAIAQLAAPIHGMAKDDLESEDVRLLRRARRLARGGVTLLTLLVVVSLVFGAVAAVERAQAQHRQRELSTRNGQLVAQQRATEREREAEVARRLVSEAATAAQEHAPDRALLLAVEAARFAGRTGGLVSGDEIRSALVRALTPNPSLVTWLHGLAGTVADVATSPDGSRVAAVTTDGHVGIWDFATYRLDAVFAGPRSAFRIAFTDPSTVVVASGSGSVSELPVVTPEVDTLVAYHRTRAAHWTKRWSRPLRQITAIAGSQSGVVAAVTVGSVPSPPDPAFGTFPASEVHLVDARGQETAKVVLPTTGIANVALAPRGDLFAVPDYAAPVNGGGRSGIDLYGASGAPMRRIIIPQLQIGGFGAFPLQLRFSADGTTLGVVAPAIQFPQEPAMLHEIDVATGADRATAVPTATRGLAGGPVGLSPDFTHVTEAYQRAGGAGSVSVADLATQTVSGGLAATLAPLVGGAAVPQTWGATAWTRDGTRFALAGGQGAVPVFALPVPDASHLGRSTELGALAPLALSRDGRIVVGTSGSSLEAVAADGTRKRLATTAGREFGTSVAFGTGVTFGESRGLIARTSADGSVEVLSAQTGNLVAHAAPYGSCRGGVPCSVTVDVAGTAAHGLLVVTRGTTTRTWGLTDGRLGAHWDVTTTDDAASGLSATGSRLVLTTYSEAAGSPDLTVHLIVYDLAGHAWRERRSFAAASGAVDPGVAFDNSPDGRRLTETTTAGITTYDLDTGATLWSAALPVSGQQLWYSADSRTLYTGSTTGADGVVAAWSAQSGALEFTLPVAGHLVDLADDGGRLALLVAHATGSDLVDWSLRPADLAAAACREANRNLSRAEWDRYVGTFDAYSATCPDLPAPGNT